MEDRDGQETSRNVKKEFPRDMDRAEGLECQAQESKVVESSPLAEER